MLFRIGLKVTLSIYSHGMDGDQIQCQNVLNPPLFYNFLAMLLRAGGLTSLRRSLTSLIYTIGKIKLSSVSYNHFLRRY